MEAGARESKRQEVGKNSSSMNQGLLPAGGYTKCLAELLSLFCRRETEAQRSVIKASEAVQSPLPCVWAWRGAGVSFVPFAPPTQAPRQEDSGQDSPVREWRRGQAKPQVGFLRIYSMMGEGRWGMPLAYAQQ